MKLALLILGLTSLLTNALPIASPSQTACYAEKNAQGAWEEVCTGTQWHPPTEEDTIKSSSTPASAPAGIIVSENDSTTTTTAQVNRRAADPARTACYAEIVNGVDTEVCTGDSWVPPAVEVSPATE
ncbi:hypothetical protein EG328_005570 [Venturia inaequalis]|uniref:Secreted protein n=1 Tax=Venturia inaequalis TaxID=5025 RepID=A0A8H3YS75_VENIN|nr:hypothetical protein EG328_005570 [Venturia inaequalis]RDI77614.1 hypothetical protein Vi05172_g12411 [Venturia inaequalis]